MTGHYVASGGLTARYVVSRRKPRRVLLVFVVKSQRKLRLRRNEKRFDEDSKDNAKEELYEALQRPSLAGSRLLRSDRAVCLLGRYVTTEPCTCSVATQRPSLAGDRSLRSDLAVISTETPIETKRKQHFDEDSKENEKEDLSEALQKEKSRARFIALPVAKSHSKVFNFLKNCGVCVGAVAAGVVLPALLRTAILSFVFPDIVLIKRFVAKS
ncbi:hypothetical protein F2Q68_00009678 [Brassica cretica]|uniref:Uncharacterized protein n=1 Tax=Brassica cretica TaxID=69181 RepID=A0A8S9KQH7_BRACR|nr:hypothetical protein F2Q68_00009678 [Brassica cretica]